MPTSYNIRSLGDKNFVQDSHMPTTHNLHGLDDKNFSTAHWTGTNKTSDGYYWMYDSLVCEWLQALIENKN